MYIYVYISPSLLSPLKGVCQRLVAGEPKRYCRGSHHYSRELTVIAGEHTITAGRLTGVAGKLTAVAGQCTVLAGELIVIADELAVFAGSYHIAPLKG